MLLLPPIPADTQTTPENIRRICLSLDAQKPLVVLSPESLLIVWLVCKGLISQMSEHASTEGVGALPHLGMSRPQASDHAMAATLS
jgi:hypothetical protein